MFRMFSAWSTSQVKTQQNQSFDLETRGELMRLKTFEDHYHHHRQPLHDHYFHQYPSHHQHHSFHHQDILEEDHFGLNYVREGNWV